MSLINIENLKKDYENDGVPVRESAEPVSDRRLSRDRVKSHPNQSESPAAIAEMSPVLQDMAFSIQRNV